MNRQTAGKDLLAAEAQDSMVHMHLRENYCDGYGVFAPVVQRLLPRLGFIGLIGFDLLGFCLGFQILFDMSIRNLKTPNSTGSPVPVRTRWKVSGWLRIRSLRAAPWIMSFDNRRIKPMICMLPRSCGLSDIHFRAAWRIIPKRSSDILKSCLIYVLKRHVRL